MEQLADGFKGEKAIVTPYSVRSYQAQNEITRQLYLTHIGYYPDAKYHYRVREEGAPEHILIYCEKGKGWIECRDERVVLTDNSFYILPANEPHAYGADNKTPWSIYWLHFKGDNAGMFRSIIGCPMQMGASDQSRFAERMQLFEEMYLNLEMGYNPENLEYISFCLMHFLASLKYIPQYREIKKIKESDLVQRSILFMKENLETKIALEDIARAAGYSGSRFAALFMQRTSFSPMEYYNQLRIQRACSYLQFTDHKIKEIAFRLGYYDPFHFSKAFSKEMELTPKEYRKRYQDKGIEEIGR
jgi:AraC-like DNA-binding protein/mannose-6-phosphate isomerase-like protein (cupin superfamily)